jgi:hypothetical protein
MFANEHADYRIKLLYSALEFLKGDDLSDKHIELDDNVHKLRKSYLAQNQKNDTIDNLTSRFIVNLLGQKKNQMAVTINGKRGLFTTGLGNVSVVANYFLKNNEDFDFVIDLSGKGNLGLRSCDRVDVCEIAKNFFGGGGHTNASGGKMPNAREFYTYEEYLAFMNNYISTKEF